MKSTLIAVVPGLLAGLLGGFAGYLLFGWIARQGFYAAVLPGAMTGLACGLASRGDSNLRGALCAVEALLVGLLSEWRLFPLAIESDGSFGDFLKHLGILPPITLIMLGLGGFLGFWWGREWTLRPKVSAAGDVTD